MSKFTAGLIAFFALLGTLAYFVDYTIDNRSLAGAYALGIISAILIGVLFWAMQLINTWLHSAWEQRRFQDNAKENYANLLAQQKVQNEQTKGALMLADNAMKHQPQNEGSYLVFDESAFDNLGGE